MISPYEIGQFRMILCQIGGDPDAWELKGKWTEFYRAYFGLKYSRINRENGARTAYLFYRKHKLALSPLALSGGGGDGDGDSVDGGGIFGNIREYSTKNIQLCNFFSKFLWLGSNIFDDS